MNFLKALLEPNNFYNHKTTDNLIENEIHQICMLYEVVSHLIVTEMRMNKKNLKKKNSHNRRSTLLIRLEGSISLAWNFLLLRAPIVVVTLHIWMGSFLLQLLRFRISGLLFDSPIIV